MGKKPVVILLAVLVLTGALVAFLASGKKETPRDLTIYFTCDTHGRLEPCGCFSGQLGGLTRLDTWLHKFGADDALLVDVGGALADQEDYHVIQYRYILQAYEKMGFHALNLGAPEAELDADTLRSLASGAKTPVISASIVDADTRQALASPSVVIEHGGRKIGILGVVDPRSVDEPGMGVAILPLDDAINRHLSSLKNQCDTLVLLAFAPETEMQRLAQEFYEFSLILGGDVRQASQSLQRENQSTILFTTNHARTVGEVVLKEEKEKLTAESFDIHMLQPAIEQSDEIAALAKYFRAEIKTTALDIDNPDALTANSIPGVQPIANYVGSESCKQCHVQEHEIWSKSGHAHAFAGLVRRESEADPTCIGCHTVGFGEPSGYRRAYEGKKLIDVGCESCHGPGSEHVSLRLSGKEPTFKFRPLGPGDCTTCHHGEFSRPFDWDRSWPQIRHGKGEKPGRK